MLMPAVAPSLGSPSARKDMKMAAKLKKGEHVIWNAPQGQIAGEVVKEVTSTASVKGHTAKTTKKDPQFLVKSGKTGKKALHKSAALRKA